MALGSSNSGGDGKIAVVEGWRGKVEFHSIGEIGTWKHGRGSYGGRTGTVKGLVVAQRDIPLTRPHIHVPQVDDVSLAHI